MYIIIVIVIKKSWNSTGRAEIVLSPTTKLPQLI